MIKPLLLSAALFSLTACASADSDPPSLASRPIEGIMDQPMRAIAPVPSTANPALLARITALVEDADAGEQAFQETLASAETAIANAAGSAPESEAWIVAQLHITALDSVRSDTIAALGELDAIQAEHAASGRPVETDRLYQARVYVAALFAIQAERYEAMRNRVSAY
jgi:predicted RNA polymerase sigma factor